MLTQTIPLLSAPTSALFESSRDLVVWAQKPPRWNFAGVCGWCDLRNCTSPTCAGNYERSLWVVCPHCEGGTIDSLSCCLYGVTEVSETLFKLFSFGIPMDEARGRM